MTGTPSGHAERMLSSGQAMGGAPLTAPSNWISETPVKPTPCIVAVVPCNTGTSSLTEMRTRTKLGRSEEHTSELQSLMRISYAVFCLKKKKNKYKSTENMNKNT